jgi:oxygen-dependent protoporphyrinogen oxidase
MGFRQEQVKQPLDGFGFLVPEKEQRRILGTIWSSTLFPHCAPDGYAALTTFVGGACQPELTDETDRRIAEFVLSELQSIMKISGSPVHTKVARWGRAIPQYTLGYPRILKQLQRFEENFQGAFLCANYRGGIAVGDCVMSAEKTAKRVLEHLRLVRPDHQGAYVT